MTKYYAGIGSRKTPDSVLQIMHDMAMYLAEQGYTLRSGAAEGADTAFEEGCDAVDGPKEIFLPWRGFKGHNSSLYHLTEEAIELAHEIYPYNIHASQPWLEKYMARNCMQVLGYDLHTPVEFVLCWTPDGVESDEHTTRKSGGTGQAVRLAVRENIPVFNLKHNGTLDRLLEFLDNAHLPS